MKKNGERIEDYSKTCENQRKKKKRNREGEEKEKEKTVEKVVEHAQTELPNISQQVDGINLSSPTKKKKKGQENGNKGRGNLRRI